MYRCCNSLEEAGYATGSHHHCCWSTPTCVTNRGADILNSTLCVQSRWIQNIQRKINEHRTPSEKDAHDLLQHLANSVRNHVPDFTFNETTSDHRRESVSQDSLSESNVRENASITPNPTINLSKDMIQVTRDSSQFLPTPIASSRSSSRHSQQISRHSSNKRSIVSEQITPTMSAQDILSISRTPSATLTPMTTRSFHNRTCADYLNVKDAIHVFEQAFTKEACQTLINKKQDSKLNSFIRLLTKPWRCCRSYCTRQRLANIAQRSIDIAIKDVPLAISINSLKQRNENYRSI